VPVQKLLEMKTRERERERRWGFLVWEGDRNKAVGCVCRNKRREIGLDCPPLPGTDTDRITTIIVACGNNISVCIVKIEEKNNNKIKQVLSIINALINQ
jgi:hypothetical protein